MIAAHLKDRSCKASVVLMLIHSYTPGVYPPPRLGTDEVSATFAAAFIHMLISIAAFCYFSMHRNSTNDNILMLQTFQTIFHDTLLLNKLDVLW